MRALLGLVLLCGTALADPLVGRWKVTGCETSPKDPADCARGEIVFTKDRVTVEVPANDKQPRKYELVRMVKDDVVVRIDSTESTISIKNGEATWVPPGFGGRVGYLRFVKR